MLLKSVHREFSAIFLPIPTCAIYLTAVDKWRGYKLVYGAIHMLKTCQTLLTLPTVTIQIKDLQFLNYDSAQYQNFSRAPNVCVLGQTCWKIACMGDMELQRKLHHVMEGNLLFDSHINEPVCIRDRAEPFQTSLCVDELAVFLILSSQTLKTRSTTFSMGACRRICYSGAIYRWTWRR